MRPAATRPAPRQGADSLAGADDQPHRSVRKDVLPGPVDQHHYAAAEADHVDQMHSEPEHPAGKSREVDTTELRDGGISPDGRHDAGVLVAEGTCVALRERVADRLRHVPALLHGDRNQHRQWSATIGRAGDVTDHEYLRMSLYLQ